MATVNINSIKNWTNLNLKDYNVQCAVWFNVTITKLHNCIWVFACSNNFASNPDI